MRSTAAAAEGLVGSLSDKAVEGRLRKAGDWLEHLLERLLEARMKQSPNSKLALVDGSVIKPPAKGHNGGCIPVMILAAHGLST